MKKFFIGCLVIFGVIFLLVITGVTFFYFKYGKSMIEASKMPAIFENPAILKGESFLSKKMLYENKRLGNVSDIVIEGQPGALETQIGIAGSKGALFLNSNFEVQSSVSFGNQTAHVDIIDIEGDGKKEFMDRGSWNIDAAIYNQDGKKRWEYGGNSGVDDMSAGNFDDGKAIEFVVGFNGGGGVHLVDENGKRLWKKRDSNVWHVEAVDIDNDGISEIIHSNAGGEIIVRNAEGKIIKKNKPQPYFSGFSMLAPEFQDIVLARDDRIWLFDFDGNIIKDFDAPHVGGFGSPSGTIVQFDKKDPKYYAFSVSYYSWMKCNVYVYDEGGELLYHEILDERCEAIATMPDSSNGEVLLVGGGSRIWKYSKGAEDSVP